jgi:serine/threonine protein kinase
MKAPTVPGYEILRQIGGGAVGRVYEALAPGGFRKAVKFIDLNAKCPLGRREVEGLQLMPSIRHPFLIGIDRVELTDDRMTVVMELAENSLRDEFRLATAAGLPGIQRSRLVGWLAEAAEALDFLIFEHHVHHLDVKPENLFLIAGHLKVGDFGLMRDAQRRSVRKSSHALTPAYAAPETMDRIISPTSDQYSLAVVFVEMLAGRVPYDTGDYLDLATKKSLGTPNLDGIPKEDQPVLLRALSSDPHRRFASCVDFIRALQANAVEEAIRKERPASPSRLASRSTAPQRPRPAHSHADPQIDECTVSVQPGARVESTSSHSIGYWQTKGPNDRPLHAIRDFARTRNAPVIESGTNALVLFLQGGARGWRPLMGLHDPFVLQIRLLVRREVHDGWLLVTKLEHHGSPLPTAVFEQHSRVLLDDLASACGLQRSSPVPMRQEERCAYHGAVDLIPLSGSGAMKVVHCASVDLSPNGLGLISASPLDVGAVEVRLTGIPATLPGAVVRCRKRSLDHQFDIGVFLDGDSVLSAMLPGLTTSDAPDRPMLGRS